MKPSEKSPELDKVITEIFGIDRIKTVKANKCVFCGSPAEEFRNEISRREYTISGLCQICQDFTFGVD